ncbi:hypothetical protein ACFW3D_32905 [Streptomyces sp. NPDC058864]
MVDGNAGPARGDVLDEGRALALIGAPSTAERLPVGGATMIIGPAGTPIVRELRPVPLRPLEPRSATRFHVAPGLVLSVSKGRREDRFDVRAGATDRGALGPLPHDALDWLAFDG